MYMKKQKLSGHLLIGASCRRSAVVSKHYPRRHIKKSEATHKNHHYWPWSFIGLRNHLHGNYSQCFFVHRNLNNAWYNKAHFLIGKSYFAIIASKKLEKSTTTNDFNLFNCQCLPVIFVSRTITLWSYCCQEPTTGKFELKWNFTSQKQKSVRQMTRTGTSLLLWSACIFQLFMIHTLKRIKYIRKVCIFWFLWWVLKRPNSHTIFIFGSPAW